MKYLRPFLYRDIRLIWLKVYETSTRNCDYQLLLLDVNRGESFSQVSENAEENERTIAQQLFREVGPTLECVCYIQLLFVAEK